MSIQIGRQTRVRIEGLFERVVRGTVIALEDGQEQVVDRGRVNVVLWTAAKYKASPRMGNPFSDASTISCSMTASNRPAALTLSPQVLLFRPQRAVQA